RPCRAQLQRPSEQNFWRPSRGSRMPNVARRSKTCIGASSAAGNFCSITSDSVRLAYAIAFMIRHASRTLLAVFTICCTALSAAAEPTAAPDYNAHVAVIFKRYCVGCHNASDKEGQLVLDRYASVLAGGEDGAVIVPGKSVESRLIQVLTGKAEPAMPPEGNDAPNAAEIATLAAWVDGGAKGPEGAEPDPTVIVPPKIKPTRDLPEAVTSVAFAPDGKTLAIARLNTVELWTMPERSLLRRLWAHKGRVNAVSF